MSLLHESPQPSLQTSLKLDLDAPIKCTNLYRGSSVEHPTLFGRVIECDRLPEFLAAEGHVYSILRASPHESLPRVLNCVENLSFPKGEGKAASASALLFPAYVSNLQAYIRAQECKRLPEKTAKMLFGQLIGAVAHLHERQVVLGDIRLGKIMFTDATHSRAVFSDLSGARFLPRLAHPLDCKGMSPAYVPPEVLASPELGHPNPTTLDVWAMGVVLYVMIVGSFPFSSLDPSVLCQRILAAQLAFPAWVSPGARRIISRMLARNPAHRPSASDLLADPWLNLPAPAHAPKRRAESTAWDFDDQVVPDGRKAVRAR
eukprot:m.222033 g.222033  ORF g.222033 m.222033 type:complete len:317 (+) comp10695_c0_seq1:104-1054(+)